ncbi:MAG: hypothetical protein ABEJ78_10285 [Haloferacaceae archaeon]
MAPISRSAFRSLLRGLSREEFEGFVADLWAARGRDVAADGDALVVTDPDSGERRRLLVRHDAPRFALGSATAANADVDGVVRSGTGEADVDADGVAVVDAEELYGMALYAIDRETCATLFDAYFDRSPTASDDAPDALAGGSARSGRPLPRRYLVAAVAVVVVAAIGVSTGLNAPGASDAVATPTPSDDVDSGGTAAESTGVDAEPDPSTARPTATEEWDDVPFPPGLAETGVTNVSALADAHTEALSGRPYRMVLVHREFVEGRPTGYRREVVDVASLTRYRSRVTGAGTVRTNPLVVDDEDVYANGSVQFVRRTSETGDAYAATPLGPRVGRDPFLLRSDSYVRWFLSVSDARISDVVQRNGRTYVWLTYRGDPWPGAENTTGSALVSSRGVVRVIHRQYTPAGWPDVRVDVTVRITDVGDADVTPPPWAAEARQATANHTATSASQSVP